MQVEKKNRIGMFNLAKGLLLIFIVIGHTLNLYFKYWTVEEVSIPLLIPLSALKFIFYGAIPAFFIIYGYTFRAKKVGDCIKEQGKYVLSKYFIIAVAVVGCEVIKAVIKKRDAMYELKSYGITYLLGICPGNAEYNGLLINSVGPAWFLLAMAIGSVLLTLVFKLDEKWRGLVLLVAVAFSTGLQWHFFIPFCIVQTLVCMAYMYCGYCIKKDKWLLGKITLSEIIIFFAIILLTVPRGNIEVSQNVWDLKMLDFFGSVVSGLVLVKVFLLLDGFKGKISGAIRTIGINSLDVFVVHSIEYMVVPWERIGGLFTDNAVFAFLIVLMTRFIFIILACTVIIWFRKNLLRRIYKNG